MASISAPFSGARIDALLREATRTFGVPVALLAPASAETARSAYASAPVTSAAGEQLGTLCILGTPNGPVPPATAARLTELAARCADALDRPA